MKVLETGNTSQRHPNPLLPRCSSGRAAKEGGQRGSRSRMMHVARALDSGAARGSCPGLPGVPGWSGCLPFEPMWLRNRKVLGKGVPGNRRREKEACVLVR